MLKFSKKGPGIRPVEPELPMGCAKAADFP